jgi:hypothetical protein
LEWLWGNQVFRLVLFWNWFSFAAQTRTNDLNLKK